MRINWNEAGGNPSLFPQVLGGVGRKHCGAQAEPLSPGYRSGQSQSQLCRLKDLQRSAEGTDPECSKLIGYLCSSEEHGVSKMAYAESSGQPEMFLSIVYCDCVGFHILG